MPTVKELKAQAQQYGLARSGGKNDLQLRIAEARNAELIETVKCAHQKPGKCPAL